MLIFEVGFRLDMVLVFSGGLSFSMLFLIFWDLGGNEGVDVLMVYFVVLGFLGMFFIRGSYWSIDRGWFYVISSSVRVIVYERDS